ncbi:MAG: ABC transporter ATP-binding protein [Verrucomicrobia bacterium]|jgi:ATP-binding cassette, subfamily B, putative efflux pump|nr:ABC transporter ATP-binding protein [Verrucomicrobiota bacterium]MBT7066499.1 ABC transporter ATP-binding protein [Verrucomicrobiota bacterium]MBT7699953.1 ABC transporter ATP-binding protein [Verrucomicrobiota bacterium]
MKTAAHNDQTKPERTTFETIVRLIGYIKPYWIPYTGSTLLGMLQQFCPISIAWIFGEAVEVLSKVQSGGMPQQEGWDRIVMLFVSGCAITLITPAPAYFRITLGAWASHRIIRDIRCDLYAHVQKLSHSFFDRNRSGSLTSRIIGDVQLIGPFLNQSLRMFFINSVMILCVLAYFFYRNWRLGLLSICLLPIHLFVVIKISNKVKHLQKNIRHRLATMSGHTQEKLAATTVVKAFTQESDETQKFADQSATLLNMGMRAARLGGLNNASTTLVSSLAPLLVILIGGRIGIFDPDTMSIGLIVQFLLMQNRIYNPLQQLGQAQMATAGAIGGMERVFDIFDTDPEVANKPGAIKAKDIQGDITFEEVTFSYPTGNPILKALSFTVPAKTSLALVGPSGSGKSTVARILNRFYDVDAGCVRIDGHPLQDYRIYSLRSQIGLVPQEPVLFSGTIVDNILYGRPGAEFEDVYQAARNANAYDFIMALRDGFETQIGERGLTLSGGQRQRIAIARAFLKDPPILLLDEATSALDSESERVIQEALNRLMRDRTTLVIAHRLSTIRTADQIAVLDSGSLVELGRHEDLLARGGLYAKLCQYQELT